MTFSFQIIFAQTHEEEYTHESEANRPISPSYRITEKPTIIDTVVPIPKAEYPLLTRNMRTEISIDQIDPAKIRIIEKLASTIIAAKNIIIKILLVTWKSPTVNTTSGIIGTKKRLVK